MKQVKQKQAAMHNPGQALNNSLFLAVIIALALVLGMSSAAYAEQADMRSDKQANESEVLVKKESKSAFKGLLYQVWGRLRALNPQLKTNKTRDRAVATMGIRGNETTSSLIEPYWKGDKTDDASYVEELQKYTRAQQYAEDGDLGKAVTELTAFLDEYDDSELKPNAQFALGISQGGMGDVASSKRTLQEFIDDNPGHPLVTDAESVIEQL